MEPQVFSLLAYLVNQRERLVSKEELLDELWGTPLCQRIGSVHPDQVVAPGHWR